MAQMNWFARRFINLRTLSRARKLLREIQSTLVLPPHAQVLELGAGGGGLIAAVHESYHPDRYVGTDFDPEEVAAAGRFLRTRFGGIPPTIELRTADALSLPFEDRSFDCVFAIMMLHHVEASHHAYEKRPQALREIRRVLRPGGLLVYADFSQRERFRASLTERGFERVVLLTHWRHEVGIFRWPGARTG